MQCKPYEKRAVWHKQAWDQAAQTLNVHPVILRQAYLDRWFTGIDRKDFQNLCQRQSDRKFIDQVITQCQQIHLTEQELKDEEEKYLELLAERDEDDLRTYRLKTLIEVGDEWFCTGTKSYTFSDLEYLTKGKRYKITDLRDEEGSEFSFQTTTNLPDEKYYNSQYSCQSLWRDNKEIWNWYQDYLDFWLEQNPNHPQTQEMIDYCTRKAKEIIQ